MEQCGQSPVFEKQIRCLTFLIRILGIKSVIFFEHFPKVCVGLIQGKSQCKHIYRMGVMISVLHQKGTPVRFIFTEEFHHLFAVSVTGQEHFKIAVVYGIRIVCYSGIDECLK